MIKKLTYFLLGCLGFASCAIENDIPYPLRVASISSIEVEGQRAAEGATDVAAVIDKAAGTVTLYVNDSVDITRLKITRLVLDPREATIGIDSVLCDNYEKFPTNDFASLDSLPLSANTRVDFSEPVTMTLSTYQDYPWKVTVNQIIQRDVDVYGMVNHVLDVNSRNVIIYVNPKEVPDLSNVQIKKLNLGGEYGKVTPDPTTVHDFTKSQTFYAARHGEDTWQEWKVFVYQTEEGGSTGSSDVFAMVSRATVKGSVQSGKTPTIEYRKQGSSDWNTVPAANVTTSGTSFTATLTGLSGSTTYNYRVTIDGVAGSEQSFTTVAPVALENGSLDEWSQENQLWKPWDSGNKSFWGVGNTNFLNYVVNITTPTTESISGKAAYLESKWAMIKLAAGNLFTGDFTIDGVDGLLKFGREFNSYPSGLRLYYKYIPATIDKIGENVGDLANLKGQTDMCQIYIALSDKTYEIRNNPSKRQLFDPNDSGIIAYGEFTSSQSVTSYKQLEIPLEYRYTDRTPKYIIIVASSSKYGDYYIGGVGSKLWLDEMELVYE